ncbi:MAG: carboxypeptidase regulatory-like domain-containing protein [Bacteroidales bacterium]|nr:carboxypeptidase regulatory-like domain-containing protein [Bacteroidales bacterium]
MKFFNTLLWLLLIVPFGLMAQWSTDPNVNNIICSLGGEQAIPKIVTCPNGDTYIGYFSNEGGNYNIRLQRLNNQGVAMWAADGLLISNNQSDTWLTDWDMTCDNTSYAILTWQDIRNGGNNAYAYRIAPDGSFAWGANGIALSNNGAFNASPKVTVTAANNAVFAWQSDNVVIMQKINPAGAVQWGANGITLSSSNRYTWPQLLPVGTDDVILKLFEDSGPVNAPTRYVLAKRFNSSGAPVWSNFTTVSNAGGISAWTQIFPFINDGSDGFYMAWHDDRDNNQRASVYVQHVNSSGVVQYTANGVEASTASSENHYYPELALPEGSTDIYVYWSEQNGNQNQWGLYGQKLNASGTRSWGNSGRIFIPVSGTQVLPIAARRSPDDMVVFYEEFSSVMNSGIKAMRINTDGTFIWSPTSAYVSSLQSEKGKIVASEFDNNQWILAWEDSRAGNRDIYAQNIQLTGELGPYNAEYGFIEGTVTLNGGSGNVMQTLITAGDFTTHPNASGFYSIEVQTGTYAVTASLAGYYSETVQDVVVVVDQTTPGVDFLLEPIPTIGYIEGTVSLQGGSGNVTEVDVRAGNTHAQPDATGYYTMELGVGSWDVEASLDGYYTSVLANVIVEPGLMTSDVDFTLVPLPPTGFIEGHVTLNGGSGSLTSVLVTAGDFTTHPDNTGYYLLECEPGTYNVTASLNGYVPQTIEDVVVLLDQTTTGIDFSLEVSLTTGFIEGMVTLVDGIADPTLTTITTGLYSTFADETGYYLLPAEAGTYDVEAYNPYTDNQLIESVTVVAGETTPDIDFTLHVNKADMICRAFDSDGNILHQVEVTIVGPDSTFSGVIEQDSLVFYHIAYGNYSGQASYLTHSADAAATIAGDQHELIFNFLTVGIQHQESLKRLAVVPNPVSDASRLIVEAERPEILSGKLYNSFGNLVADLGNIRFQAGQNALLLNALFNYQQFPSGIYVFELTGQHRTYSMKLLMK